MLSMKRLTVIAVVVICLLAEAGLFPQLARADGSIRCTQEGLKSGSCRFEIRAPGSGGQPGKPGRPGKSGRGSISQPTKHPGENTAPACEGVLCPPPEERIGDNVYCVQRDLRTGKCDRYEEGPGLPTPTDEPGVPAGVPEPVVLARVAVGRMDLRAPEIGLWPESLEELPEGHNYVGWHNWMWVRDPGPATWGPITKTVTESGYAITATAAVTKVTWEMGNGDTKECDKGVEHLKSQEEDQASPTCGYVYHQRGDYTVTATAHWVVVWSGLGQQGVIEMDLSSQVHTSVIEAFAVNVPSGGRKGVPSSSLSPNPTGTPTVLAPCPTNHNKHGC